MSKQKLTKKADIEEQIAKEHIAPIILNILEQYTATEMAQAINENLNLSKGLQQDTQYLNQIKLFLMVVPDKNADKLSASIKKKKWIDWFLNNIMKPKRPDIYNQIIYNPKGGKYIRKQIRKIVKIVFD